MEKRKTHTLIDNDFIKASAQKLRLEFKISIIVIIIIFIISVIIEILKN